ncbi:acyl-CoA thioesterase [Pelagibius sp.]|uniref:acyl-CoA thioesterase n=1 Tax=Pelagibius sp. TaxID=1931238 RepID=UPI003B514C39
MTFVAERLAAKHQRANDASKPEEAPEEADARRDKPQPRGELTTRTWAFPNNANPRGSIFGGWIMSQMDAAGAISAEEVAQGPVVTLAVDRMTLLRQVKVGDVVCCYTDLERIGRTSLCLYVEVWISSQERPQAVKASEGQFTFVAIDAEGLPQSIRRTEQSRAVIESSPGVISVPGGIRPAAVKPHNDNNTSRSVTRPREPLLNP